MRQEEVEHCDQPRTAQIDRMVTRYERCPACGEKTRHSVVRAKGGKSIIKCSRCGSLHYGKSAGGRKEIMLILSKSGKAVKKFEKFDAGRKLARWDVIELKGKRYEVRSMEDEDGQRPESGSVEDIRTVWIAPYEKTLSISVYREGKETVSKKATFPKDAEIKIGDVLKAGRKDVRVTNILSKSGEKEEDRVEDILALQGRPADASENQAV